VDNYVDKPVFSPEAFLELLRVEAVPHHLHHHKAVFSVGEADEVDAAISGLHTRNLFLKDKKGKMFLVTLDAHMKMDMSKLAPLIGAGRLSFASAERLWQYLGVTPGSVTPFAILNDTQRAVTLILEENMMKAERVNFHPLINTMTVGLSPGALVGLLKAQGITPSIVDLRPAQP
jgi:Ala-tRNA(Pro) deacylase